MNLEHWTLLAYFVVLLGLARLFYRQSFSSEDFVLGGRSLNFWLAALSAHASDMSAWLFLGYPALVFEQGVFAVWSAIGLVLGMFFNWHYIAPRLRELTAQMGSLTLSSYFAGRFQENSIHLRLVSSLLSVFFFTAYIASGLVAIGVLSETLLGLNYTVGVVLGLSLVVGYVLLGGYRTIAWMDLFQGLFLLGVILVIPLYLIFQLGGIKPLFEAISLQQLSTSLFPNWKLATFGNMILTALGWGLGYFGQPQILTKFMGIKERKDIPKAQFLGLSWQLLSLGGATLFGLLAIFLFPDGVVSSEHVVLNIVKMMLPSLVVGLVLCAIVAATTNVMAGHILIVASHLSEDFYRPFVTKRLTGAQLLAVSRWGVMSVACVSFVIAYLKLSSVYQIVLYAWSGLGATFGPLVIFSLYSRKLSAQAALWGMCVGGCSSAIWPYVDQQLQWDIPAILPAFALSFLALYIASSRAFSNRLKTYPFSE